MPRKILGVIPARFASTRFPGKVLASIAHRPMLQHVYERAAQARYLSSILIATDDERISEVARSFGARVRMTRSDHPSGTDRVAEAASAESCDIVVNIQGDEPLIDPAAIDAAILPLVHDSEIRMSTLSKRIEDAREIADPNVVKVVSDRQGDAIYFSRCPIPYHRDQPIEDPRNVAGHHDASPAPGPRPQDPYYFKHIGLYVYRRDFLLRYPTLPTGPLERAERLEQLRALENGFRIRVVETEYESLGVDTPEDMERVARLLDTSSYAEVETNG